MSVWLSLNPTVVPAAPSPRLRIRSSPQWRALRSSSARPPGISARMPISAMIWTSRVITRCKAPSYLKVASANGAGGISQLSPTRRRACRDLLAHLADLGGRSLQPLLASWGLDGSWLGSGDLHGRTGRVMVGARHALRRRVVADVSRDDAAHGATADPI